MTRGAKAFWFLFLCLTFGAGIYLPTAAVVPPTSYGLPIGWTNDAFVTGTTIYYGTNPGPPWIGFTNFIGTNWGVVRLQSAIAKYWLAAAAWNPGNTSLLSAPLTLTNYARYMFLSNGNDVGGFTIENPSKPIDLFPVIAVTSNNWRTLP